MVASEPDLVLLERFKQTADAQAFAEILRRYAGAVFATCLRVLHDSGRAEDATQETFYRLMVRPDRVSASLGGWLHRSATRLALDIRRSERSRQRRESRYVPPENEPSTWADVAPHLDESLAALPDATRELLVRHFLRGEPQSVLAAEAKTSPATMSRKIAAAVDALRREMQKRGICVAPALLLLLLGRHAIGAVPSALRMSLGKLTLYCTARGSATAAQGIPTSWLANVSAKIIALRWAFAAVGCSIGVSALAVFAFHYARQLMPVNVSGPPAMNRVERNNPADAHRAVAISPDGGASTNR